MESFLGLCQRRFLVLLYFRYGHEASCRQQTDSFFSNLQNTIQYKGWVSLPYGRHLQHGHGHSGTET